MQTIHLPIKHTFLNNFIDQIILFRYDMDNGKTVSPIPFPPQPVNCLYFYPYHRVNCFNHANQTEELLPHSTIIGPQLSRVDLTMGYKMLVIIVMFKPGGMHRLLGIPMHELLGKPFATELFFGKEIEKITEKLNETSDFEEMLKIVHNFLWEKAKKLKHALPLEKVLDHIINSNNPMRVDHLAAEACVSVRQLERQFKERIGMPPKEFTRLVRFSKAWILRERNNDISWAEIAHKCHYADQMHHPVLLQIMWGHGIILNKKAMEVVGLSETEPDPLGGWYGRKGKSDTLNGKIYEYAQWPIWTAWTGSEQDNLIAGIQGYMQEMLGFGITTTQDLSAMISPTQVEEVFSKVNPPLRLRIIPFPGTTKNGRNLAEWRSINDRPSPLTRVSGVKYLIDGTPLDQTALLKKPYENRPDWYGRLNMPIDTIKTILKEAIESDNQLLLHFVGDSSVAIVLPLIKEAASPENWKKKRLRIEHSIPTEGLTDEQMQDIKNMGIVLMPTPQYLGPSPMASLLRNQIHLGIAPDMLTNPFVNIMIISSQHVDPAENLTREEAVIAYTLGNAFAEFAEHEKGSLTKGKLADLAVLTHDIFTIPAEQLPMVRSILTMVDGEIVYIVN